MRTSRALGALAAALLLGAPAGAAAPGEPLPDVLLVILDGVRADRLSAYGHEDPTSPQLAALARQGVRFADVTAPGSWTWPSHAALFTGEPPWVHGAQFAGSEGPVRFRWGPTAMPMREDLATLAERFARAGYRTGFLTANADLAPEIAASLLRGFEVARRVRQGDRGVVQKARAFLAEGDGRPTLLVVNLIEARAPYHYHPYDWVRQQRPMVWRHSAPGWAKPFILEQGVGLTFGNERPGSGARWETEILDGRAELPDRAVRVLRALYDGEIAEVDATLGNLIDAWREREPDGIVAVCADHGEYLGERGLVSHGVLLYPGVLRVPLVIEAPGRLPAGAVVETPVELRDLHDTLLDLALGEDPGRSLVPVVAGAAARWPLRAETRPRSDLTSERLRSGRRSCRWEDETVVLAGDAAPELYDLAEDPGMLDDRAGPRPERARELAARCRAAFAADAR